MQTIELEIPVDQDWDAGTRVQVFTDFGTGTVDTSTPLLPRPVEVFPGQQPARGVGLQPVGVGRVGDGKASRPRVGGGRSRVGVTPVGTAPVYVRVIVDVPAAFGSWKFAARVVDAFGNIQSGAVQEIERVVSGTEPPPLESFALASYDSGADQVTFSFAKQTE